MPPKPTYRTYAEEAGFQSSPITNHIICKVVKLLCAALLLHENIITSRNCICISVQEVTELCYLFSWLDSTVIAQFRTRAVKRASPMSSHRLRACLDVTKTGVNYGPIIFYSPCFEMLFGWMVSPLNYSCIGPKRLEKNCFLWRSGKS